MGRTYQRAPRWDLCGQSSRSEFASSPPSRLRYVAGGSSSQPHRGNGEGPALSRTRSEARAVACTGGPPPCDQREAKPCDERVEVVPLGAPEGRNAKHFVPTGGASRRGDLAAGRNAATLLDDVGGDSPVTLARVGWWFPSKMGGAPLSRPSPRARQRQPRRAIGDRSPKGRDAEGGSGRSPRAPVGEAESPLRVGGIMVDRSRMWSCNAAEAPAKTGGIIAT